jgi:glycosyltransferase involved in cell wall biosynthesis
VTAPTPAADPAPSLAGVRVACFFPWPSFTPTGAWSRYSCLWRFLAGEGATVTLPFLEPGEDADLQDLAVRYLGVSAQRGDPDVLAKLLRGLPDLEGHRPEVMDWALRYERGLYLHHPTAGPWIEDVVRHHDVVTCEYPVYAPLLAEYCRKWGRPLVVTSHDLLYELHGTTAREKEVLQRREIAALRLADARVFCHDGERQVFAQAGLDGVTVLNTGDARGVQPGAAEESRRAVVAEHRLPTPQYCLFVGSAHGPNLEAVAELRRLAPALPGMTVVVAGRCCDPVVDGGFVALGPRSDAELDQLHRGAFAILVPLRRGTGVSVKLFQAFSHGKAVVSTPVGARGYAVADGRELLLVPEPADFPAAVRRLADDPALRGRLEEAARRYALQLDYRTEFRPYGDLIRLLVPRPAAPAARRPRTLVLVDNNLANRIGHHSNYALAIKEACGAAGAGFAALVKTGAEPDILAELAGAGVFSQGNHEDSPRNPYPAEWGGLRGTYDFLLSNDSFFRELAAGLARCARPGDVVLIPNAGPRQMLGLALLLQRRPILQTLQYVLILRYSMIGAAGPLALRKPALDKESAERHALAMGILQRADQGGSVRFATDSEGLANEYKGFAKRPIEVLPIPHTQESPPATPPEGIPARVPRRVRLVFLGDAREEKGFELLPGLIRAVRGDAALAAVEFVVQAYVSSHYHQRMAGAIEEIARQKPPQVQLVRSALTPGAYQALLHSADLVLLPYDAVTYRSRTSGPFVEALCANKPVIVPGDSWMSRQLGDSRAGATFASGSAQDLARAVRAAVAVLAVHTTAAAALGARFREFHNPRNFLHHVMNAPARG